MSAPISPVPAGVRVRVPAKINVEFNASCTVRGRASTCSGDVKGTTYAYVNGRPLNLIDPGGAS